MCVRFPFLVKFIVEYVAKVIKVSIRIRAIHNYRTVWSKSEPVNFRFLSEAKRVKSPLLEWFYRTNKHTYDCSSYNRRENWLSTQ